MEASPWAPSKPTKVDHAVLEILEEERFEGQPVSSNLFIIGARQCASGFSLEGFKATHVAQSVKALIQTRHVKAVTRCRKEHNIPPSAIYNMDQTMVHFDVPSKRTNNKGPKDVHINTTKVEKKGFTVALAASASGEKLHAAMFSKETVRWCAGKASPYHCKQRSCPSHNQRLADKGGTLSLFTSCVWLVKTISASQSSMSTAHTVATKASCSPGEM